MSAHKGTGHYKRQERAALVMIISFPFFLYGFLPAVSARGGGIIDWLSGPYGAITLFVFFTSSLVYCMFAFDDVLLDYVQGGALKTSMLLNRLVAILMWVITVFCIYKIWLGA